MTRKKGEPQWSLVIHVSLIYETLSEFPCWVCEVCEGNPCAHMWFHLLRALPTLLPVFMLYFQRVSNSAKNP